MPFTNIAWREREARTAGGPAFTPLSEDADQLRADLDAEAEAMKAHLPILRAIKDRCHDGSDTEYAIGILEDAISHVIGQRDLVAETNNGEWDK